MWGSFEHHNILGEVGNDGKTTGHNATMGKHTNSSHGGHPPHPHANHGNLAPPSAHLFLRSILPLVNLHLQSHHHHCYGHLAPSLHPPLASQHTLGGPHQSPCRHHPLAVLGFTLAALFRHMKQNYMVSIPDISKPACVGGHPFHGFGGIRNDQRCGIVLMFMPQGVWQVTLFVGLSGTPHSALRLVFLSHSRGSIPIHHQVIHTN